MRNFITRRLSETHTHTHTRKETSEMRSEGIKQTGGLRFERLRIIEVHDAMYIHTHKVSFQHGFI